MTFNITVVLAFVEEGTLAFWSGGEGDGGKKSLKTTGLDVLRLYSTLASPLRFNFLDTNSLFVSFLGCKVLCIIISFLVL